MFFAALGTRSEFGILLDSPASFSGAEALVDFELGLGNQVRLAPDTIAGVKFSLSNGFAPLFASHFASREFAPTGTGSILRPTTDLETLTAGPDLILTFAGAVDRVGMEIHASSNSEIRIEFLLSGGLVDSFDFVFVPVAENNGGKGSRFEFFGFKSVSLFDQIRMIQGEIPGSGGYSGFFLDNLRFERSASVPEPASAAVFVLSLAALVLRPTGRPWMSRFQFAANSASVPNREASALQR